MMTFLVQNTFVATLNTIQGFASAVSSPNFGIWQMIPLLLTAAFVLVVGLALRRFIIQWLDKTVVDNWIVQVVTVLLIIVLELLALSVVASIELQGFLTADQWKQVFAYAPFLGDIRNPQFLAGMITNIISSLLIVALGIGIARTLMAATIRGLADSRIDINIRTLLGRVCYIAVMFFVIIWLLSLWRVELVVPVAVLGSLAIGVTFSIQDILKNLVAGFYLLVERPFHIGDLISTSTYTGEVEDVQIRATKLRLVSGEQIMIPNALMFGGIVLNNTYYGEKRAVLSITMEQEKFIKRETFEKILETMRSIETIIGKPEPEVVITGYQGANIQLTLRFWIMNRDTTTVSDVMYALREALPHVDLALLPALSAPITP